MHIFTCMLTIIDQLILAIYLIRFLVYFLFISVVLFFVCLFVCSIADKKKKGKPLSKIVLLWL